MNSDADRDNSAASWDLERLQQEWQEYLTAYSQREEVYLPYERVKYQAEQEQSYRTTLAKWQTLSGEEREAAWEQLKKNCDEGTKEMMPICVRCGECCRRGSPTLLGEDMVLITQYKIPWNELVTLRAGERARSPYAGGFVFLEEEKIKIREKAGSHECVFYNAEESACTIHSERPTQCRAQACWDASQAEDLAQSPALKREEIFSRIDTIKDIIAEHEQRCSFSKLRQAFEELGENQGKNVDEILEMVAFEDHFRQFIAQQYKVPQDNLDFLFGRSFEEQLPLFGIEVETNPDGTKTLKPKS